MIRQTLPWNVDYYRDRGAGVYENSEPIVQLHVGEYSRPLPVLLPPVEPVPDA